MEEGREKNSRVCGGNELYLKDVPGCFAGDDAETKGGIYETKDVPDTRAGGDAETKDVLDFRAGGDAETKGIPVSRAGGDAETKTVSG